jgi:hypothetical protein
MDYNYDEAHSSDSSLLLLEFEARARAFMAQAFFTYFWMARRLFIFYTHLYSV